MGFHELGTTVCDYITYNCCVAVSLTQIQNTCSRTTNDKYCTLLTAIGYFILR
jgi:hypothetical protein